METFRNKFVFYKSPNTHSPVIPAAREVLGFLSRWSSIFPFQHFFQNCHIIPLSLTPATKYFTLVLRRLRYGGKRTATLSKVVPNTTTGTSKTLPIRYLQKGVCFLDTIQGTAAAVQMLTPQIRCKWMDSWDSSGQPFFHYFFFHDFLFHIM